MNRYSFLLLLLFSFSGLSAQTESVVTPIDSVLMKRFQSKDINVILGIPPVFNVLECQFLFSSKGNLYCSSYSAPTKIYTPNFNQLQGFLKAGKKGDRIIFSEIIVLKGDRKMKLISQMYSFQ
ncbi:MAG: hypothetical protein KA242_09435 [Chitinophagales bacterium]|jgi:hypothetical protein|nr:hypothetical protein [Chitinophagales bacterium]